MIDGSMMEVDKETRRNMLQTRVKIYKVNGLNYNVLIRSKFLTLYLVHTVIATVVVNHENLHYAVVTTVITGTLLKVIMLLVVTQMEV